MRIVVKVHARAKHRKLEKVDDGYYKAWVTAPPEAGRANEALRDLIAEEFGIRTSAIRIVIGKTAREKVLQLDI